MKGTRILLTTCIISSLFLVGCSSKVEESPKEDIKMEALNIKKLPLEINELVKNNQKEEIQNFTSLNAEKQAKHLKNIYDSDIEKLYLNLHNKFKLNYEDTSEVMAKLSYETGDFDTNGKYLFKENLNVFFVLDASGSMGKLIEGKSQMQIAKSSINTFLKSLPSESNVSLRVYGHKGKGTNEEKQLSCASSESVYKLDKYNEKKFQTALNTVNPSGWTPTELALKETLNDIKDKSAEKNTNIIYLISDGISTCDDNPIEATKTLVESDSKPVINVIGFNVDSKAKEQLEQITEVSKGTYKDVANAKDLTQEFKEMEEVAKQWKLWLASKDVEFENNKTLSTVEIFNYTARLQQTSNKIQENIQSALDVLLENKTISEKEYEQLVLTNDKYFEDLTANFSKFKTELRSINTENYNKAVKEIKDLLNGEG